MLLIPGFQQFANIPHQYVLVTHQQEDVVQTHTGWKLMKGFHKDKGCSSYHFIEAEKELMRRQKITQRCPRRVPNDKTQQMFNYVASAWMCYSTINSIHTMAVLCRVGSRLGVGDWTLERFLARSGCEVHCFDPSLKQPHLQEAGMWLHRLSVDWRDPNPAAVAQRQHANNKKLATILNDFGHREVRGWPLQTCTCTVMVDD